LRILYVTHRLPDAPNKGEKIRSYHQLLHLCARHEVHVVALEDGATRRREQPAWRERAASLQVFPLSATGARLRSLRAAAFGGSLTSAHFADPKLLAAILSAKETVRPDLVIVYSGAMDPFVGGFRPRVLDLVDVDSVKFTDYCRERIVRGPRRLACRIEGARLQRLERRATEDASLTLVCTDLEADLLRRFARPRRLEVVGNGVDLDLFRFRGRPRADEEILFVGALDYPPNSDAAHILATEILPRVRRHFPRARVTLVGHRPTPAVLGLRRAGIEVVADAPEILSYLHRATLSVQPLRLARGIQNKALEALAAGLPLVLSEGPARALGGNPGEHFLVGRDLEELASHTVRLLQEPARRDVLAQAGRSFVEQRYSWRKILERFGILIQEAVADRD